MVEPGHDAQTHDEMRPGGDAAEADVRAEASTNESAPIEEEAAPAGAIGPGVRVDKWLWAARFFKTRSQAAKACTAGHVKADGDSLKAARVVRPGQRLEFQAPSGRRIVVVLKIAEKRGSAAIACTLYEDHSPPPPPREERSFAARERGAGRPVKRERRLLRRLRGR